ncbi:MAG TPA: phenylalanine 4-monooxygenase [Aliiroseovarius sp.]|nr:phenylalanine 4-monooxygenase [Aliiroseovarius sp.]
MSFSSAYRAKSADQNGFIPFDSSEDAVWHDLMAQQMPGVARHMARPWLDGLARLDLPLDRVAQPVDVSAVLRAATGWQVEPVPAVIGFARFFDMLSRKTFPAASFLRSRADFNYIKEPDIFHEIFGHAPLLTDPRFAEFSQAIGRAGARAEKQDYVWLIRLYWFTIEFGLTRENGQVKALGSGLASSPTELSASLLDQNVERRPFDVIDILRTPYRIDIHQPLYYVLEDLDDLFALAGRDLNADIQQARQLGLFQPLYPAKSKAS